MAADGKPEPREAGREELDDAPPFGTWRLIYFVVLGALAVEIAAGIALTLLHRR
jgi:hypothetical protein